MDDIKTKGDKSKNTIFGKLSVAARVMVYILVN